MIRVPSSLTMFSFLFVEATSQPIFRFLPSEGKENNL